MDNNTILCKGNDVIALAAIRCGCDGYFGYPITPQSEIMEKLMEEKPWETTGMVVLQAESEVASINMLYGGAACGKKVMTSSSSPGVSLMCEGFSYLAGAELPCLIVNVVRGGPGLGTIQPAQSDYFQAVKGGGHGDYHFIVLAPASVQEMNDFVDMGFDLAFKYRNPVMILADGIVGQMMEKVTLSPPKPRWTDEEIIALSGSWATTGKPSGRRENIITSLAMDAAVAEKFNEKLQRKFNEIRRREVRLEKIKCDDAEYLLIAYGAMSRICEETVDNARAQGIRLGLLRPITLFPFPSEQIAAMTPQLKGILSVELSAGQMVEDVRLAVGDKTPVTHFGRLGGIVPAPDEVLAALKRTYLQNENE
ncbi:MAG: 3-methyl-2-oxobutanoate dehydrogenase subunit VorB [Prevotellaceae bacterium]|jgi:2-oxoglutarate ferredoxin oxidoreductase subunit alpha|nr:3-methyl-2-oxobutanoate dehydrogenase subunit VorB [Prevotellaceae bacterium]